MSLSNEEILKLLQEDSQTKSKRGGGRAGPRKEDTSIRQTNVWFKLSHHLCLPECPHRQTSPTGKACWNPDCVDTRSSDDRGINIVAEVNGKNMCRYCFLDGWLL